MVKSSLVGALVLTAACFSGTTPPQQPLQGATQPSAPHDVDYSATIADPLGFLPIDAELVIGIDANAIRHSTLWPMISARATALIGSQLTDFKTLCGFDMMTSVGAITLAVKHLSAPVPDGVAVIHGFDRGQVMACIGKAPASGASLTIANGVVSGTRDGTKTAFTFVDPATFVVVFGPTADAAQLQAVLHSRAPLHDSPAFNDMLKHVDLGATMWGAANGNSSWFDKAASIGIKPKAVYGSLTLQAGLLMNLRIRLGSAGEASQFAQMASGQATQARMFFDRLDIGADDADVVVDLGMSDVQLQNLLQMMGVSFGP